jgi:hypothetical protein
MTVNAGIGIGIIGGTTANPTIMNNGVTKLLATAPLDVQWNGTGTYTISYPNPPTPYWVLSGTTLGTVAGVAKVGMPNMISMVGTLNNVKSSIFNEEDGGGVQIENAASHITSFVGANSDGAANGLNDFIEIYSKNTHTLSGTRIFFNTAGIGFNLADTSTWSNSISNCDCELCPVSSTNASGNKPNSISYGNS